MALLHPHISGHDANYPAIPQSIQLPITHIHRSMYSRHLIHHSMTYVHNKIVIIPNGWVPTLKYLQFHAIKHHTQP